MYVCCLRRQSIWWRRSDFLVSCRSTDAFCKERKSVSLFFYYCFSTFFSFLHILMSRVHYRKNTAHCVHTCIYIYNTNKHSRARAPMSLYIFKYETARALLFCGVDGLATNVFPYYLPSVLLLLLKIYSTH